MELLHGAYSTLQTYYMYYTACFSRQENLKVEVFWSWSSLLTSASRLSMSAVTIVRNSCVCEFVCESV